MKSIIIEFSETFVSGTEKVLNKLSGVEVRDWEGHNYGPSIIMCPP